jgi:hypothetical protein
MNLEIYAKDIEMRVNDTRALMLLRMGHVLFGKLRYNLVHV